MMPEALTIESEQFLMELPEPKRKQLSRRLNWLETARANQLAPEGDEWTVWFIMAGRGFGKTRTGAEDCAYFTSFHDGARYAILAATQADLRKTCFEGDSGLMSILDKSMIKGGDYNKSLFECQLENGSLIQGFSADKADRLRGPQFHRAWCDEMAAWRYTEGWDMLEFCVRLPDFGNPQILVTSTPKPTKLIKQVASMKGTIITTGSTYDNKANLAPAFLNRIASRYEGTRLGEQEILGKLLAEIEGSLWSRNMIHVIREQDLPELIRIVVAIDPSVTANENSDECGIIVAGKGIDGRYYILNDLSGKLSPLQWARRAVNAFWRYEADRIIGEANNGGDLVERNIKFEDSKVAYKKVHASRGKITRAEPIAQLYEKGLVSHVGILGDLEDQMCTYDPTNFDGSPDRLDAMVWALTELADMNQVIPRIR